MRTGGAEALAFDVACLCGPEAALPHGAPGDRPVLDGTVLLFDFGAQVAGYRSDMTRTLFVGEPTARDLAIYELVARAQAAPIAALETVVAGGRGAAIRAARSMPWPDRSSSMPGTASTSATGPATASASPRTRHPRSARPPRTRRCPARRSSRWNRASTSTGEMGVRIEDLVAVDAAAKRVERLTQFPRDVLVVGA